MAVGGQNTFDIIAANPVMTVAVKGFPVNDPTQASVLGVRKMIEFETPPIARSDSNEQPWKDFQEVKIKYEAWQDNYAAIKRAYLYSQSLLQAIVQIDAKYYNFMDYGAGQGLLGMEMALDVTDTEITLTLTFHGKVTPTIWSSILTAAGSAATGGSGGTSISGLTAGAFDDTEYGIPGVESISVGSDDLGLFEPGGTKFSWTMMGIGNTMSLQPIPRRNHFKNTIAMYQNTVADLQAMHAFTNTEQTITWVLRNGVTFVFNDSTKLVEGEKINDQLGLVNVRHEGSIFADATNAAQSRVTFNDSTKTITFHRI